MVRPYAVAAVALLLLPLSAAAYELKLDSSGEPVRWLGAVEFVVDQDLSHALNEPEAELAVLRAAEAVSASAGLPITVRAGSTKGVGFDFANGAENHNELIALDAWDYDARAIAVTVITVDVRTHEIIDADIALNTRSRKFKVLSADSKPDSRSAHDDIQNTVTHELGHAVGLAHNAEAPRAVMYPAATRGEVSKRLLSQDDVDGLLALYGTLAANGLLHSGTVDENEHAAGCSAVPGGAAWLPFAATLLTFWRRRRMAATTASVVASVVASTAAFASEPRVAPVSGADTAVRAEVISRVTLPPQPGARVLTTQVRLKTTECLKGHCPDEWVLEVPGGRYAHYEQTVEGLSVPEVGEAVAFTVAPGEQTAKPRSARVELFRLRHGPDLVAFLQGLAVAQRAAGSPQPQR